MKQRGSIHGMTLLSVLIALVVFSLGMLSLAGMYARFTASTTENQNISTLAQASNRFWGILYANPSIVTAIGATATYNSTNVSSAPLVLQAWLNSIVTPGGPRALPGAQVTVSTGADSAGGNTACDPTTGCSVTLTIQWTPTFDNAAAATGTASGATRAQTFYYQLGL